MNLDYSGATRENSAICVLFWLSKAIRLCELLWVLLFCQKSLTYNESEISKVAISVNVASGDTTYVVFNADGWSTEAVIAFVVFGGIFRA